MQELLLLIQKLLMLEKAHQQMPESLFRLEQEISFQLLMRALKDGLEYQLTQVQDMYRQNS